MWRGRLARGRGSVSLPPADADPSLRNIADPRDRGLRHPAAREGVGKDVKIVGTNSLNFFRISESFKKRTANELKTNPKRTRFCAENSAIGTQNARWCARARAAFARRRPVGTDMAKSRCGAGVSPAVAGASRSRAPAGCPRDSGRDARTTIFRAPCPSRGLKTMLKSWERTHLTSLESVKVPKNELKTNSKRTAKTAEKMCCRDPEYASSCNFLFKESVFSPVRGEIT